MLRSSRHSVEAAGSQRQLPQRAQGKEGGEEGVEGVGPLGRGSHWALHHLQG